MKRKVYYIIIVSLSISFYATAQSEVGYRSFVDKIESPSIIKTGTLPIAYYTIREGSFYIQSDEYKKGSIKYNGKMYYDLLLNINAHLDELYIKDVSNPNSLVLTKDLIEYFYIDNRFYKNFRTAQMSGFYEVMVDGDISLYKKVQKVFYERIVDMSMSREFNESVSYFIVDGDNIIKLSNPKKILNLYKSHKRMIKRELRKAGVDHRVNPDAYLLFVIEWVNKQH